MHSHLTFNVFCSSYTTWVHHRGIIYVSSFLIPHSVSNHYTNTNASVAYSVDTTGLLNHISGISGQGCIDNDHASNVCDF